MTDKEQIKCKYRFQDKEKFDGKTYCTCFCELCEDLLPCDDNCQIYEDFKQLARRTQECEELKKQLMQKSEVDMFFNTPIEGWSSVPCEICPHKAENEQLKDELSVIQHNCNREGCKYYDDDTFKVFYECKAQKALQLSANSVTTKYCDLLQTLTEIKEIAEKSYRTPLAEKDCIKCDKFLEQILQKIREVEDV